MVIPSVLERIIDRIQVGRKTVDPCQGNVAPGIVGIGADLYAVFIVYCDDVPLQVPLKPEGIELARGHTFCAVLHPDRSTVSVVEINAKIAAPLFCRNLRTGQGIGMFNPVDRLACADALIVVVKRKGIRSFGCRCKLPAVLPGEAVAGITQWVSNFCCMTKKCESLVERTLKDSPCHGFVKVQIWCLRAMTSGSEGQLWLY